MSLIQTMLAAVTTKTGAAAAGVTVAATSLAAAGVVDLVPDVPPEVDVVIQEVGEALDIDEVAADDVDADAIPDETDVSDDTERDEEADDEAPAAIDVEDDADADEEATERNPVAQVVGVEPGAEDFGPAVSEAARSGGADFGRSIADAARGGAGHDAPQSDDEDENDEEEADAGAADGLGHRPDWAGRP